MEHWMRQQTHGEALDVCTATAAEGVFTAICERERDAVCVGAMLKCYINHQQDARAIALYEDFMASE